jgi:hypothetical protein
MARAHDRLRRLLGSRRNTARSDWHQVLGSLVEVCRERSPESEAVLRRAATFAGTLALELDAGLPHAMSPEDFLRSVAVQTLGRWDRRLHQDVIVRAAALADHESVITHARPYLL